MVTRFFLLLALILGIGTAARADDISAAGRGVVRVVTIAQADGEIVGFGHGTGFAISPTHIVTNAHVVELAARYPDNVTIGVVPSEGSKSYTGRLIAYDARRDLALIAISGARLPPLTLFDGGVSDGETVIALGYPGNVDLATAQSAADYIHPLSPVRSQGGYAGSRQLEGVSVLLHTAGIARGNSGGPLLDGCGRIIGVNSAITRAEEGDTSFGFAIADAELAAFLRGAKQDFATTNLPCTPVSERIEQDRQAEASAVEARARARETALAEAGAKRAAAMETARRDQARTREDFIGLAGFMLFLASLSLSGAALLATRGTRQGALWSLAGGLLLVGVGFALFFGRPNGDIKLGESVAATDAAAPVAYGRMTCRFVPERSRINTTSPHDVAFEWGVNGCVNGHDRYVETGRQWEHIDVPADDQTVSVLSYQPEDKLYSERRYLLGATAMERARKLQGKVPPAPAACPADGAVDQSLADRQAAIRETLPAQPDEWLVYQCGP